jgi:hypothetical protein
MCNALDHFSSVCRVKGGAIGYVCCMHVYVECTVLHGSPQWCAAIAASCLSGCANIACWICVLYWLVACATGLCRLWLAEQLAAWHNRCGVRLNRGTSVMHTSRDVSVCWLQEGVAGGFVGQGQQEASATGNGVIMMSCRSSHRHHQQTGSIMCAVLYHAVPAKDHHTS